MIKNLQRDWLKLVLHLSPLFFCNSKGVFKILDICQVWIEKESEHLGEGLGKVVFGRVQSSLTIALLK